MPPTGIVTHHGLTPDPRRPYVHSRIRQGRAADGREARVAPRPTRCPPSVELGAISRAFVYGPGRSRTSARRFEVCRSIH